jgi:hypothetical protein
MPGLRNRTPKPCSRDDSGVIGRFAVVKPAWATNSIAGSLGKESGNWNWRRHRERHLRQPPAGSALLVNRRRLRFSAIFLVHPRRLDFLTVPLLVGLVCLLDLPRGSAVDVP